MADPTSEAGRGALKLDFDRSLVLQFRGSAITSDAGLLPYRELDDALSLTDTGADVLSDTRTGRNGRHRLAGLLRRSVFGRLAGYEYVNDAHRLCRDPAMRWVVGDRAITGCAASASQKPARHGGAMDQRGQGRDQMDAAVMPFLRGQCRPPSASCACLQPRQFHSSAGDAQGGGAVVTNQPARQADQDRCQGRQPWPLRQLPNGRAQCRIRCSRRSCR